MSRENGHKIGDPPRHPRRRKLDLVGTREAADILGVERPRIGRWKSKGLMPDEAVDPPVSAGPLWYRRDIESMRPWVEANRRRRDVPTAA